VDGGGHVGFVLVIAVARGAAIVDVDDEGILYSLLVLLLFSQLAAMLKLDVKWSVLW